MYCSVIILTNKEIPIRIVETPEKKAKQDFWIQSDPVSKIQDIQDSHTKKTLTELFCLIITN